MKVFALIGCIPALLLASSAHANLWGVSHSCSEPYTKSQYAIDEYKECIEDFVDEQQRAIRKHRRAAEEAIEEWNSFARGY